MNIEKIKSDRLLLLRHCYLCRNNNCIISDKCKKGKEILQHISKCSDPLCQYNYCHSSKLCINHLNNCENQNCQICNPIRFLNIRLHDKIVDCYAASVLCTLHTNKKLKLI